MTRLRVLVVEDEVLVADYIAEAIEEAGHEVAGVLATGEAALEAMDRNGVDLVLLDIKLKGSLSGVDVADAARKRLVPHVFISGSGDPATRRAADATGPVAFLQKPFSPDRLAGLLKQLSSPQETPDEGAAAADRP